MSKKPEWEIHPDFETIKKYANYIDRYLDKYDHKTLTGYLKTVKNICEYYAYLESRNFISALPFYPPPKGIRSGVSTVLPSYAFKDYLFGNLLINLSNFFNNRNTAEISLKTTARVQNLIKELIETIQNNLKSCSPFKDSKIMQQTSSEILSTLMDNNFSYEGIGGVLS